jgi:hypothetical protein
VLGRFVLGRDRTGRFEDRTVDYLKIETSLDGRQWQVVFEQKGLTTLNGLSRGRSLHVEVAPVKAHWVRATVDSLTATNGLLACVDEFEVYAPVTKQTAGLPRVQWGKPASPVRRTTLEVKAFAPYVENEQEVLQLELRNRGAMTALFCEPHPLLVYRTDLFIENNNCFIPPGESRIITIRAAEHPRDGLSLAQTGWKLSCWNADELTVAPSPEVILSVGRADQMCREFDGYFQPEKAKGVAESLCSGKRPDSAKLSYRLFSEGLARFSFDLTAAQAGKPARLRLHTADQSDSTATVVQVALNGRKLEKTLPRGLGIQRRDPAHLAFPATIEFEVSGSDLRKGKNSLTVAVQGDGWFSWDALDLVQKP